MNIPVSDFESLVTHHPFDNRNAVLIDGVLANTEQPEKRSYALIGTKVQEIATREMDGPAIKEHQILVKKDFILEHPDYPTRSDRARAVDVPSPTSGYIGRVVASEGLVDIYDRQGGDLIARVRHMKPIAVKEGSNVSYGEALGTQGDVKTENKHVHLEMDTRHYQNYENFIADLTNGRLAMSTGHRSQSIPPLPVLDDGVFRLGETNPRIQEFQGVLINAGYLGAHGRALRQDGVYRLEMQPAVLAFQRDRGLAQTGDIDRNTMHVALPHSHREAVDRMDHVERNRAPFAPTQEPEEPVRGFRPGPEDYRQEHSRPHSQASQTDAGLNPGHSDYALYQAIRKALPDKYSDDMAAHVMLQAKIGGVAKADDIDKIIVRDERIFVMGTTPGFRTDVYLSQAAPPMQETVQRSDEFDKQQTQQRQQWLAQEQQLSQDRGMRYSL